MYEELDPNKIAAEFLSGHIDTLFDAGKNLVKETRDKFRLRLDRTYRSYFAHLVGKYSKTKSFLVRGEPVSLYDFYVPLELSPHGPGKEKSIPGDIRAVLSKAKSVILTGSAGSGKSMLLKHLLLDALRTKTRVPVFIELRQFNAGTVDLVAMVYKTLVTNKFDLEEAYVQKALEAGHFLLILDGFDEVAPRLRGKVTSAITAFTREHDANTVIMTSRPDPALEGWEGFSLLRVAPLSKAGAIALVQKLPFDDPIKKKFIDDLRSHLYEEHQSFLSNPLLLSIMLLSYGQSASIPSKLSVFYNQAYEALFERHDVLKDGFQRQRATPLDIQDFGRVFAAFSLRAYDQRKLEFTSGEALEYIEAAQALTGVHCKKKDYLRDVIDAVALLVQDGIQIVYAHRSFQEYFAARFICEARSKVQEQLLKRYTRQREFVHSDNVLSMIYEMRPDLVETQYLIPELERFFAIIKLRDSLGPEQHERYIRLCFKEFAITEHGLAIMRTAQSDDARAFLDLVAFVLNRCTDFADAAKKSATANDRTLAGKYRRSSDPNDGSTRINLDKDPEASQLISDLASLPHSWFSLDALRALRAAQERFVEKARVGQESIDEILKTR
jgi:predicted NACHT family NTPase